MSEKITRFERARIVSARALQLSLGAPPLAKVGKTFNAYDLAKMELEKKLLPLAVLRKFPNNELKRIEVM